jgi:hypothetical protein
MDSNFTQLSSAIATVLQGVTNADGSAAFQTTNILQYPSFQFQGYPAVTVAPSDNRSDYATTTQNLRTYTYFIDIFYLIQNPNDTKAYQTAFTNMRYLVDITLDALDNCDSLNGACDILIPSPSAWSVIVSGASLMLTARISLGCKTTVVTNNG